MLAQGVAAQRANDEPLSPEERAWLADLTTQLRDGLEPAVDEAALQLAGALLVSAVLAARPSGRSRGAALPANTRVLSAGSLASYAARGLGACGDVCRVWTAARSRALPLPVQPQALLPVQPWLVAGVLRCNADGLRLESGDGSTLHVEARDALAVMPLVDRPVLAQRWALPPSNGLPPVLEVHSFVQLDTRNAACARTLFLGEGCAAGAVVAVSPLLCIHMQKFCIVELRGCRNGGVQHVFLDKDALRLRTPLLSAAGRGYCIVLSALTPRTLFPEQPDRCWPVLVSSASTALSLHGCSAPGPTAAVLCACDTCLREDTLSLYAEVMEQELSDAGLAIRVRICSRCGVHADKEVPLLLAHYLSGAPSPWQLPGMRPGAEVAILHAHPISREGVLLALGASSRTTLRIRSFSPRCAAALQLLHTCASRLLLSRSECASFSGALDILRVHGCGLIKLPDLLGAEPAADGSVVPAAFDALLRVLAPSAGHACRGTVYEELLASSRCCARAAAANDAALQACSSPSLSAVLDAAVDAWHSRGYAASSGNDWLCDTLDGAPLVRSVSPISQLFDAASLGTAACAQPVCLLAWLNYSSDGWVLWDASGHLEAVLEGCPSASWGANECVVLSTAFIVVEGARAACLARTAPTRMYVSFHAAAVTLVAELAAQPPRQRWRYTMPVFGEPSSVRSLLRWVAPAPPGTPYLSVTGLVIGECLRSFPHLSGVQPATALQFGQASQGTRLRLRDLQGRDFVDVFLDHHRKRLPPGVGRGAIVTIHQVSRLLAKKRNAVYLRAMDVSLFYVNQAPRCDWAASPAPPPVVPFPAVQIGQLCCPDPHIIDCCLSRIRANVVSVMRFELFWTCMHCGSDVPEASMCAKARAIPKDLVVSDDAPWFGRCGVCTLPPNRRPPGSVQLFLKGLSVLLEDGSGAAQCWADGDAAWALLGAWHGARDCPEVAALVKRHGRLSVREAWVHPDDWDGSAAQQITVRGRSVLSESEAAPIVSLIQRALEQPSVVVWASRAQELQDINAEAQQPLDELAVLAQLPADCQVRETCLGGRQVRAAMRRWPYLRAASVEKLDARAELACILAGFHRPAGA